MVRRKGITKPLKPIESDDLGHKFNLIEIAMDLVQIEKEVNAETKDS
jgi:hypothetical protein